MSKIKRSGAKSLKTMHVKRNPKQRSKLTAKTKVTKVLSKMILYWSIHSLHSWATANTLSSKTICRSIASYPGISLVPSFCAAKLDLHLSTLTSKTNRCIVTFLSMMTSTVVWHLWTTLGSSLQARESFRIWTSMKRMMTRTKKWATSTTRASWQLARRLTRRRLTCTSGHSTNESQSRIGTTRWRSMSRLSALLRVLDGAPLSQAMATFESFQTRAFRRMSSTKARKSSQWSVMRTFWSYSITRACQFMIASKSNSR